MLATKPYRVIELDEGVEAVAIPVVEGGWTIEIHGGRQDGYTDHVGANEDVDSKLDAVCRWYRIRESFARKGRR